MNLLHISLGPVQGFIAAFKKTRDLQAGSKLLLEMVRAVSSTLLDSGAELVFPARVSKSDTSDDKVQADAANVVVAIVTGDPGELVGNCYDAAIEVLKERWSGHDGVLPFISKKAPGLVDENLANGQLESFLEFFAGWAPYDGANYKQARKVANARVAASKAVRRFGPAPSSQAPKPKSPQSPQYESVLATNPGGREGAYRISDRLQKSLLLGPYEGLDAISLIKRFYFERNDEDKRARYASMSSTRTVAVQDLLNRARDSDELRAIDDVVDELNSAGEVHVDSGTVLFGIEDDLNRASKGERELLSRTNAVRKAFLNKFNEGKSPRRYYAVLLADGDGMGTFLDTFDDPGQHTDFSRVLSGFTGECQRIVEQHDGLAVYAGGDDVLALCPVDSCLAAAQALHDEFETAMEPYGRESRPTLTVAVAICPISDDLQDCIAFAHRLEKSKTQIEGKNALIVGVRVRGGSDHGVAMSWTEDPVAKLQNLFGAYEGDTTPRGFAGDVLELAALFSAIEHATPESIAGEYKRLCGKKESSSDKSSIESLMDASWRSANGLRFFGELLTVAHFMTRRGAEA